MLLMMDQKMEEGFSLLNEMSKSDPRIRVIKAEKNGGDFLQLPNISLEMCTGEYTALMDQDDELTADAFLDS